ncbi:aspartokinase 1, chloroplastic-like [Carex rostrata]
MSLSLFAASLCRVASSPGTLITKSRDLSKIILTSIVLKSNVTMQDIVSTRMLGQFGFLAKVFSIFEDLGISVDCVATSEVSVSLTLDPSKLWSRELIQQELDNVVEELEKIAVVCFLQHRSIISLIGNVQRFSLILAKAFALLRRNGVNVHMILQGASKVNISFMVNDSEAKQCVKAHSAFFENGFQSEIDAPVFVHNGSLCTGGMEAKIIDAAIMSKLGFDVYVTKGFGAWNWGSSIHSKGKIGNCWQPPFVPIREK